MMLNAVKMENGVHNGVRTDHDRDPQLNGVNGDSMIKPEPSPGKGKQLAEIDTQDTTMVNGSHDDATQPDRSQIAVPAEHLGTPRSLRMNDLPDEIVHITTDMIPLGLLLARLAQVSHNQLQDVIRELATKPIPPTAVNGNGTDYRNNSVDDTSPDSLEKKAMLLNFVQGLHSKWVKALVITDWSKKYSLVSKLIDLKVHISDQLHRYDQVFEGLANVKRDLAYARLPSPDLKTALQVLKTAEAPWMPEFNYIEPLHLTPHEQLKWIENLNTLLSVRLTLDDYESIPFHFRDYSISSGRVTFRVKGEFEVDLTIADEDFEKQFWFIDFRFLFSPAPVELSDRLRAFLELKVNEVLATDGLAGCYTFLHEFVLTHKVSEFTRQAAELSRSRWVDTLRVERLNRAMSIQYWATRYPPNGPKSWIILAVHSGRKPNEQPDPKSTSYLCVRWFKDNKEVKEADIKFDVTDISTESLLKTVIANHVAYILSTIHGRLEAKPRFVSREAGLSLHISKAEPIESALVMQLSSEERVTARIDPITGYFAMNPHSRVVLHGENRLNYNVKDPAEEGFTCLEGVRCVFAMEELNRRGKSMGWAVARIPLRPDELKPIINTREIFQAVWLKRQGWNQQWYLMISLSLGGDQWWLVELANSQPLPRIMTYVPLHLASGQPNLSDTFFTNLTTFATGIISHVTDLRELHGRRISNTSRTIPTLSLPAQLKLPTIFIRLSDLLPHQSGRNPGSKRLWAMDFVRIMYKGVQKSRSQRHVTAPAENRGQKPESKLEVVAEARLTVTDKAKFSLLKGNVDNDVLFNHRLGQFAIRLRTEVGQSVVGSLAGGLQAIERLVDFVDAVRRRGKGVSCEIVTLREVVFSYGSDNPEAGGPSTAATATIAANNHRWTVRLDLSKGADVDIVLEKGNPHLRVLDMLTRLARSPAGFELLPSLLPLTLPIMRGLDRIEDAWEQAATDAAGSVEIMHRTLEWIRIRYRLPAAQQERRLDLVVRMRNRRGEFWWHVSRDDKSAAVAGEPDEFAKALKPVWDSRGEGWKGLGGGAAARLEVGVEALLEAVDGAVRGLLGSQPPPPASSGLTMSQSTSDLSSAITGTTMSFSQSSGGSQPRRSQPTQLSNQSQAGKTDRKAKATAIVID